MRFVIGNVAGLVFLVVVWITYVIYVDSIVRKESSLLSESLESTRSKFVAGNVRNHYGRSVTLRMRSETSPSGGDD